MALKMAVVVDYQNAHLTAAGLYMPGCPPEDALIDPYRFASQLAQARNATNDDMHQVEVSPGLRSFGAYQSRKMTAMHTGATRPRRRSGPEGTTE